jgi:phage shock protein A
MDGSDGRDPWIGSRIAARFLPRRVSAFGLPDCSKGATMSGIIRNVFRWTLIGGLALGGVTLLVGPEKVAHGLAQARITAQSVFGVNADDPMVLRQKLRDLAEQYPDRIADVRGELAEVQHQIDEMKRENEVSKRVVAYTTDDLENLETLVTKAEDTESTTRRAAVIRYKGVRFDIGEAYQEGRRINAVRNMHKDRLSQGEFQIQLLDEQKDRLSEILTKLESEYETYQGQLWQLDRQIDAIERNDYMIELMEQQQATLRSFEKYGKVSNLNQIESKLAELRTKQEAQLEALAKIDVRDNYEERARYEIEHHGDRSTNPFENVVEIELDDHDGAAAANDDDEEDDESATVKPDGSIAFSGR